MKLVVFGLSLSSSWGNGHATTYRALLRAFAARGHDIVFYEWDAPWYRGERRDLTSPASCRLVLYGWWGDIAAAALDDAADADAILVGAYVHEGPGLIDALLERGIDVTFYDIDTPVTVAQLGRGDCPSLRRDQVPAFALYLSFTGGPSLEHAVREALGAREARPLYCCVDAESYRPKSGDSVSHLIESVHPDDRRAPGDAARRRILQEHSASRRAEQLEHFLALLADPLSPPAHATT